MKCALEIWKGAGSSKSTVASLCTSFTENDYCPALRSLCLNIRKIGQIEQNYLIETIVSTDGLQQWGQQTNTWIWLQS